MPHTIIRSRTAREVITYTEPDYDKLTDRYGPVDCISVETERLVGGKLKRTTRRLRTLLSKA